MMCGGLHAAARAYPHAEGRLPEVSSNPVDFAPQQTRQILNAVPAKSQAGVESARGQELCVWLASLRSFFVLDNLPLEDAEREHSHARNFINEARIVRQVLRRCLLLCLSEPQSGDSVKEGELAEGARLFDGGRNTGDSYSAPSPAELARVLGDLSVVSGSLVERGEISFRGWLGFGDLLSRELERAGAPGGDEWNSSLVALSRAQPELLRLACALEDDPFAGGLLHTFALMVRCLARLNVVENLVRADRPLKQSLPVFTLVHEDARAASATFERLSLLAADGVGARHELLDGAAYALGMELKKVFSRELVGYAALRSPSEIYNKTETATYLLRDCFQQTIFVLAQTLDSALDCAQLFATVAQKTQASLALRAELWGVLEEVRRSERERERSPLAPLLARLRAFQSGGMRHLMYKDWESFERFVAEVTSARGPAELTPILHRFGTYLEALFTQVNMRAVLADYPFEPPAACD
jgi:hypothetical protein